MARFRFTDTYEHVWARRRNGMARSSTVYEAGAELTVKREVADAAAALGKGAELDVPPRASEKLTKPPKEPADG